MRAWAGCVAVGLWAATAHAQAPMAARQRVAVLELAHAGPLADDVLRVSADLVRGAALKQLPRSAWQVMTRENIFELLPPGTDLSDCVADCEVETGRRLGAWLVVTGEVADVCGPYSSAPTEGSARRPVDAHRVYRGGAWFSPPRHLRATARERHPPGGRSTRLGFRLAR